MATDTEILERNAHISDDEVRQDIADTIAEIVNLEREAVYYESVPMSAPSARLDHMRAMARRNGIFERREFIRKLEHLLELRKVSVKEETNNG